MSTTKFTRRQLFTAICLALAAATVAVYWSVTHHGFTNIDDDGYITGNSHVRPGLTWAGIVWAFHSSFTGNWHPLTWISHMLDCQMFGVNPAAHHLISVLFHVANALLLFILLNRLTGALWRSAIVAALFAWHPLHVESVAWAAERKDVLSAFFWILTLITYTNYVQRKSPNPRISIFNYILALLFFACGLMSKPMVVTLPFVLLLLDFWPLQRFGIQNSGVRNRALPRLILEKIPFFALALASSAITFIVQKGADAVSQFPLSFRAANALVSYLRYISKTFWPADLALPYPLPSHWPVGLVIFAALFLAACSALFLICLKRRPYLAVGWFWFLGTLVPAIGLVQVGVQAMADRYTYIPGIGLFVLVVWGVSDLLELKPHRERIAAVAVGAALAGCLICTSLQLRYWRDSIRLFLHAIAVTENNYLAYNCLGNALEEIGRKEQAEKLYAESVRVAPTYAPGQFNLGMILLERGDLAGAAEHLQAAVQISPNYSLFQYDYGTFLLQHGRADEAGPHFSAAIAAQPDFAMAHSRLAQVLSLQHKWQDAVAHYREALRVWQDFPEALNGLAWILATNPDDKIRSGPEAVRLAQHACALTKSEQAGLLTTLATAYAETGNFPAAIAAAQKARALALAAGQRDIAAKDDELLKYFASKLPFRESH